MKKLRTAYLTPIVAVILAACGGGADVGAALGSDAGLQIADGGQPKVVAQKFASSANAAASRWVNLSTKADAFSEKLNAVSVIESEPDTADGVYLNIDELPSEWEDKIKSALDAGQIVVVQTTDKTNGYKKMQEVTSKTSPFGVKAAAVMLYKSDTNSIGLLPYNFDEMDQLSDFMKKVARRTNASIANTNTN